jgi:hypothetical protein
MLSRPGSDVADPPMGQPPRKHAHLGLACFRRLAASGKRPPCRRRESMAPNPHSVWVPCWRLLGRGLGSWGRGMKRRPPLTKGKAGRKVGLLG